MTGSPSSEGGVSLVATEAGSRWQGADPTDSPRARQGLPPTVAGADLIDCQWLWASPRRWHRLMSSADLLRQAAAGKCLGLCQGTGGLRGSEAAAHSGQLREERNLGPA